VVGFARLWMELTTSYGGLVVAVFGSLICGGSSCGRPRVGRTVGELDARAAAAFARTPALETTGGLAG